MKRGFDIVLAVFGLLLLWPVFLLIALAVRIDSPGPAFFSQARIGKNRQLFRIHKFRKFPDRVDNRGSAVTLVNDARMTTVGRILERTKLDELPQLWNILVGEMSFVGPRPETPNFADLFVGVYARIHDFQPGIFGPSQVAFRSENALYPPGEDPVRFYRREIFPAKATLDLEYFPRATLFSDIGWIVKGVWVSAVGVLPWKMLIRNRWRLVLADAVALVAAWGLANLIRFGGMPHAYHDEVFTAGLWLVPPVILLFLIPSAYRGMSRHLSIHDVYRLCVGVLLGWSVFFAVLLAFVDRGAALGLAPLAVSLSLALLIGQRLVYRHRWQSRSATTAAHPADGARVLVYGAGRRGVALANLLEQGFDGVTVIGFLDDNDDEYQGRRVAGRVVAGAERDLANLHSVHDITGLWLTFQPDSIKERRLGAYCRRHGIQFVILPEVVPFRVIADAVSGGEPAQSVGS